MKADIDVTVTYPHPAVRVWEALTSGDALAAWLMPNEGVGRAGRLERVGQRFTFRTRPAPGFDGIVRCEVLELDPPRRMVWSWAGGKMDSSFGDDMRWVLLRPPGSNTSITLVTWFESMPAGSMKGAVLGCDDLDKTLAELAARGVSFAEDEVQEAPWGRWKTFDDPDGNGWVLQQTNPGFNG